MGPTLPLSKEIHATKYRLPGESFSECNARIAGALTDNSADFYIAKAVLDNQEFLPGGRIQASVGALREGTTPYNCYVSRTIGDSMADIMDAAKDAALTMRAGGGIGYDFSTIRPKGHFISTLGSIASGPVSFMEIFDAVCQTISSAGHRRGAQMGVLRIDHPDILEFIHAKQENGHLSGFNISVGVTDKFMLALKNDDTFDLTWHGEVVERVRASALWNALMRSTWDWAEPGVLFLDTINKMNNLWYCEDITATNPCGEQPLPPYGACLLGSLNLTKFIRDDHGSLEFDYAHLGRVTGLAVRMLDRVIDIAHVPLAEQSAEAQSKRRMGIGVTGAANAGAMLGMEYGSHEFKLWLSGILRAINRRAYTESVVLATERGPFPMFDRDLYLGSQFVQTNLPKSLLDLIGQNGIRNSHLTSIAPTGTISLTADNVSSGIEPVFANYYDRSVHTPDGVKVERVEDYAYARGWQDQKTADQCSVEDHLGVLLTASGHVDSAVSKTCNVGSDVSWEQFKGIYMKAWEGGAKGCTTFRADGKRAALLVREETRTEVCRIDTETGRRECE